MRAPLIAVVDYGAGNLRSVEFALDRLGIQHRRASAASELAGASGIILPGVGAAAAAMRELESRGLDSALRSASLPLLGICLGMQLLTETSDEGDTTTACLGLVPGRTRRLEAGRTDSSEVRRLRLPHTGWNSVRLRSDPLFRGLDRREHFYFLHSHRVECPGTAVIADVRYGECFPAALRRGRVAGVQFHPEKSGSAGLRVLESFCRQC